MGDGREYLRVNITACSRGLKCKMSGKIRHCKNFAKFFTQFLQTFLQNFYIIFSQFFQKNFKLILDLDMVNLDLVNGFETNLAYLNLT